jgi:CPA2 family monovalent cation:H+ antiporter-2
MHEVNPLESLLFYLFAAVVFVPFFRRFHLGAILGYLFAGVLIGPEVFNLISDPESVLHFSEIGVVFLLFVIGLELNPNKLWKMRSQIGFLGGGQLLLSTLIIAFALYLFPADWQYAVIIGLALALSSTAFSIQLMAEKGILASANGRRGFAILLMQDLAVIPILLIVQAFGDSSVSHQAPWWYGVLAVVALLLAGRYLLNPLLGVVARFGSRETMTASALFIVVGAAYLMDIAGLSMGMGAFLAGMMLANSHFRHQLETDIEPFKGLTLGLFFIAIGMMLNIDLLLSNPLLVFGFALSLMIAKALIISGLLRIAQVDWRSGFTVGLMLSQGGEFAFVIMGHAGVLNVIPTSMIEMTNLVVGISMVLTVPLVALFSVISQPNMKSKEEDPSLPEVETESEVLILGFGRFGQITGRILAANHIPFTALDNNPSHINFIKHFGNKIHFGDITRLDVLRAAGIENINTILLSISDSDKSLQVLKAIKNYFPEKKVIVRARSRMNYLQLKHAGADTVIRELFSSSVDAAAATLLAQGYTASEAIKTTALFRSHDEALLEQAIEHHDNFDKLIEIGKQGRLELEQLFNRDKGKIS